MSVTLKYYVDAECDGCGHLFRVEVTPRVTSTGGELEVLRLAPSGQLHLTLFELPDALETCPSCGEPIE